MADNIRLTEVKFSDDGNIIDTLSGRNLKDTPEERVRQKFINILQIDYSYPKELIRREIPIQQGSKIMTNSNDGSEIRADIVVYTSKKAAVELDQGNILFVVECKKLMLQKDIIRWCHIYIIRRLLVEYGPMETVCMCTEKKWWRDRT